MYIIHMLNLPTDGEDVQAQSPLDGALVPVSSDGNITANKRPGDEAGVSIIVVYW